MVSYINDFTQFHLTRWLSPSIVFRLRSILFFFSLSQYSNSESDLFHIGLSSQIIIDPSHRLLARRHSRAYLALLKKIQLARPIVFTVYSPVECLYMTSYRRRLSCIVLWDCSECYEGFPHQLLLINVIMRWFLRASTTHVQLRNHRVRVDSFQVSYRNYCLIVARAPTLACPEILDGLHLRQLIT